MIRIIRRCYSLRPPPKSLLIKQSNRLNNKDKETSKLIVSSLRDSLSFFQGDSQSQDDDEIESLNHKTHLNQLIESGELERLASTKFNLNRETNKIPLEMLINGFKSLNEDQLELIQEGHEIYNSKDWPELPTYMKQLGYYLSFGSYGPRNDIPFTIDVKPLDFTFKHRCGNRNAKCLTKDMLTNPYSVTKERQSHFYGKTIDPFSKIILGSALGVCLIVGWKEWQLIKQDSN